MPPKLNPRRLSTYGRGVRRLSVQDALQGPPPRRVSKSVSEPRTVDPVSLGLQTYALQNIQTPADAKKAAVGPPAPAVPKEGRPQIDNPNAPDVNREIFFNESTFGVS
eukprot:Gregarina_sp_Poly_1__8123@NODE_4695_length_520_cov_2_392936_g3200_i0_p2_GENE_NODE_4695_length_520_cov_2_392936_g3200_i0NODE_4695_length_520_cov_2_392936_g3200_i0_p2_ORF_typecomplete_len108_score3_12_NODE_4695_length_520_cov_2_392936_g3200_i014337